MTDYQTTPESADRTAVGGRVQALVGRDLRPFRGAGGHMGWNAAYTAFEAAVIRLHDEGRLNADILAAMAETFRGTDIDSGGSRDLTTQDGYDAQELVVLHFGELPERPKNGDWEQYWETISERWCDIAHGKFGWC